MRTTCSVEAYNGVLNRHIANRGHFFTFIHDMRNEEQIQRDEMHALIDSGHATATKRRKAYVVCVIVKFLLLCCCVFISTLRPVITF